MGGDQEKLDQETAPPKAPWLIGPMFFSTLNVIFSACYEPNHRFLEFWRISEILVLTSLYVVDEVRRNCESQQHSRRLEALLDQTMLVSDPIHDVLPAGVTLPAKDKPILAAAVDASADLLITGDKRHFGRWMNRPIQTRYGSLIIWSLAPASLC